MHVDPVGIHQEHVVVQPLAKADGRGLHQLSAAWARGIVFAGIDARELSYGEVEGRKQCWDVFQFIKETTPGFEQAYIVEIAPQAGMSVRGDALIQMLGKTTAEDLMFETPEPLGGMSYEQMAAHSGVPVVNALTDDHHPCQALADVMTMRERWSESGPVGTSTW